MTAGKTLIQVIINIWVLAGIVILCGVFFVANPISYVLGELTGSLAGTLYMIHLYRSIDVELDLPEKKAVNHSRIAGGVRSFIMLGVLLFSAWIPRWINPFTVFIGMMGVKVAVHAVPVINNFRKGE